MKTPAQIVESLLIRVHANWHIDIATENGSAPSLWPRNLPLGSAAQSDLESNFANFQQQVFVWRDWAAEHNLALVEGLRRVNGTIQKIPTHVTINSLDTAAALVGGDWERRISRGRIRLSLLRSRFPSVDDAAAIVRAVDAYSDVDFEMLCAAGRWFARNADTAAGLTPREVPIEGLHAKWLNSSRALVEALAGVRTLGLVTRHPSRIHFSYLDEDYLSTGGRRHDSATVGDSMFPPYLPEIVVITENKDTALHFPSLPGAIAIEGNGFSGADAIASFDWITDATEIIYWGDMDASGFEIVNHFRSAGLAIDTIFMDLRSFETYQRFGATTDAKGREIVVTPRKDLAQLTRREKELYDLLTDPQRDGVRRVEQERIPLDRARDAVRAIAGIS